ncbi:Uncharacterized protein SCF082_LOCUS1092, partial [Durusdinium trenchii]
LFTSRSELLLLLKTWTQLLSQLALREQLLAPGGWRGSSTNWAAWRGAGASGAAAPWWEMCFMTYFFGEEDYLKGVVFLVERISQDMYSFTVCNRGPAAAQYHPTKFIPDGLYGQKMKIQATLTFQVHRQHLCDPGFWAMAFGQWVPNATEYHRAEVLYDVLLPWLAGVSFGRLTEKLETPSDEGRSNTSCMKNLLEAPAVRLPPSGDASVAGRGRWQRVVGGACAIARFGSSCRGARCWPRCGYRCYSGAELSSRLTRLGPNSPVKVGMKKALHVEAGHDEAKVDLYKPRQELAASGYSSAGLSSPSSVMVEAFEKLKLEDLTRGSSTSNDPLPNAPKAQAAMGLLAAYRAAPPPLRPEQLPRVIALFFSVPNVDELHRRLSELVTAVWATHGGGSLLVCEAPLGEGGEREWPRVAEPRALAKLYGLDEEATEPKLLLFRANGQLQSKEGLQMILKDPRGRRFPWPCKGLDSCGAQLLQLGARSLAKRSKESRELGRLAKARGSWTDFVAVRRFLHLFRKGWLLEMSEDVAEITMVPKFHRKVCGKGSPIYRGEMMRISSDVVLERDHQGI